MNEPDAGAVGRILERSAASAILEDVTLPGSGARDDWRVKKVELVVRCQELARFLRSFDESNWARWIEDCITAIRHDSTLGTEQLIKGYNGIGSISDVYLCPEAGHRLDAHNEIAINEQFLMMLSKVNHIARDIVRW